MVGEGVLIFGELSFADDFGVEVELLERPAVLWLTDVNTVSLSREPNGSWKSSSGTALNVRTGSGYC